MWRSKGFSFINIAGLTLGLTACLLIGLFVWDEKQYDRFVPEGEQVYRIYNYRSEGERSEQIAGTPPMYAVSLGKDYPEVQSSVRVLHIQSKVLLEHGDKQIYEDGGIGVDSTF